MNTVLLDPKISQFETQEQADSYDRWFRAKVQEAIDSKRPSLPHDAAMARVDNLLDEMKTAGYCTAALRSRSRMSLYSMESTSARHEASITSVDTPMVVQTSL